MLVVCVDEPLPRLTRMPPQNCIVVVVQGQRILVQVIKQGRGAKHFSNFYELVVVVVAMEKWLLAENHASKHTTKAPHVQRIVVVPHLKVHQQFRSFEITRSDTNVVLPPGMVELCQTPVDKPQFSLLVVDHDVVRLHISVHDAVRVAEVQGHQHFINVVPDVQIRKCGIKNLEVGVVDGLKDQARGARLWVPNNVQKLDDVWATTKILENLDFSKNLLFLHWLEDLDHTLLIIGHIDSLKHFTVLSTANPPNNFVVILVGPPCDSQRLIVPVFLGTLNIHISIHPCAAWDTSRH
mmetsp:Transcript_25018/g.57619  ORF Transcript_25018/g.57619 Transcript_25018/m.57619 type:complete len:295 (-) Transcript_25018:70-954(-)